MLILVSTLILLLILFGLIKRHNRKIHVPVMLSAFALDVGLVLVVEITRHAIEKAVVQTDNTFLLFHIAVSLLTLVFYALLTVSGFKILKGYNEHLPTHRKLAYYFIAFRLTNYITSFWISSYTN